MTESPMQTKCPFFVVGSPRSGTTLLQVMLSCLDGVHFPEETKFLHLTVTQRARFGPLNTDQGVKRTIDRVVRHIDTNKMDVDRDELIKRFKAAPPDDYDWFDVLLTHMQERAGCRRIGEKTPRHMPMTRQILERFPDSKVIAIIRDGRDVATSQGEAFASDVISSAYAWRDYQRMHRAYKRDLPPDRYTSVRYEDLVTDPEPHVRRLCEFLDEPFSEKLLQHEKREFKGFAQHETHKLRTLEPVTSSRVARYKREMTPGQIAVYQLIAGSELRENGYEIQKYSLGRSLWELLIRLPGFFLRRIRITLAGTRRGK